MDLANLLGGRTGCCTGNRKKWAEWATVASATHFAVSCVTSCPATQYCDHMLHPIHGAERKTEREHYPCLLSSPFSLAFPAAAIAAVGAMRRPTSTSVARRSFVRSFASQQLVQMMYITRPKRRRRRRRRPRPPSLGERSCLLL